MSGAAPQDNRMAQAQQQALLAARERVAGIDLAQAAARGGLTLDDAGRAEVILFGRKLLIVPGTGQVLAPDGGPLHVVDETLALRYCELDRELRPVGESITFRDLPGGNFYLAPILARTSGMTLKVFGNDQGRLQSAIRCFPHEPLEMGDYAARVHAIGRLELTLVYRLGDDEFPPTLDFTFDRVIGTVYRLDEVAALVNRFCVMLMRAPR